MSERGFPGRRVDPKRAGMMATTAKWFEEPLGRGHPTTTGPRARIARITTTSARPSLARVSLPGAALVAVHFAVAVWTFAPALFDGRLLYLRDVSAQFYPNLVFLERSLAAGTLPLWHPGVDAGEPFLFVYPPDLLLVAALGARWALALGPPLHMLLSSLGAAALARILGLGAGASTAAGLAFALSGFLMSTVNLVPLHQAAAWAPVVLLLALRCAASPRPAPAAALAVAAALQVSTLAGEIVLQTALAGVVLLWRRIDRRGIAGLAAAGAVAALLSAPALFGAAHLVAGTRRGGGFSASEALAFSMSPVEALALVLPRFFGDMHTFTRVGFWGESVFVGGFPYLVSLYAGLAAVTAALRAGRDRLWLLVAVGLVLALGGHGPFGAGVASLAIFRAPVKFVFLATLGAALLAGRGIHRAGEEGGRSFVFAPGVVAAALAVLSGLAPGALGAVPALADPAAQAVIRTAWPAALGTAAVLALAAAAALFRGGRVAPLAAAAIAMDLLVVHGDVNRFAPRVFYELRPAVRDLLAPALAQPSSRVFGYGVANTPGLRFAPEVLAANTDVWLYYLDRQVLWGRTAVLDGLEAAFDEDRNGWAPLGATLTAAESEPARFRDVYARLRGANVRFVLSFAPLPADLVLERGSVLLPEVLAPLRLYELRDALPRAFFVSGLDEVDVVRAPPTLDLRSQGPHAMTVGGRSDAGYFVVLSGWNPAWRARAEDGAAVEVLRAGLRYVAVATPGGERRIRLDYRPRWWPFALALCGIGAAATLLALARRRVSRSPAMTSAAAAATPSPARSPGGR